jgi:PAS domain S-box-containing protein
MAETYSLAPVWFVDVVGSALMVVFSFLSVMYARRIAKHESSSIIWTYLLWLSVALAVFAVSRSVGHIAKRLLLLFDMHDVWVNLRPFSGALNTVTFVVVAAITLFFQKVQRVNNAILRDKRALEDAGRQVQSLNRDLELLVQQRTDQLSQSERKYRRVFEGSMDMIFILDAHTLFIDINHAGVQTLGYATKDQVIGALALENLFVCREELKAVLNDLKKAGYIKDRECRVMSGTDRELILLISATGRRDHEGSILGYEGIAKDMTSRRNMERQLQIADKLASLGQISTGIAHEINNPLGIIMGYTQLLLRSANNNSQLQDDLKIIEKHARNCKTVVEDLLKFARSTRTNKTPLDLNQCLKEVASLLAHQLELDKITLVSHFEQESLSVVGDQEKLKQVFMNLLVNAKQAIKGPGTISMRSFRDDNEHMARVLVSDTGCGIAPEALDKIFDPFFTTKSVGEGTGLGLSVSYGIVQDHNGRIDVESQPGTGTTFTVSLPL